jgi:hypothetical protein
MLPPLLLPRFMVRWYKTRSTFKLDILTIDDLIHEWVVRIHGVGDDGLIPCNVVEGSIVGVGSTGTLEKWHSENA